jgi:predicted Zn-dependent peptidase
MSQGTTLAGVVSNVGVDNTSQSLSEEASEGHLSAEQRKNLSKGSQELPAFKLLELKTYTLHNGLKLIVIPTEQSKYVLVNCGVGVGFGRNHTKPYAHFTEHLVAMVQKNLAEGFINAFTSFEETAYLYKVKPTEVGTLFSQMTQIIQTTDYPEKLFETEKNAILHEYYMRQGNNILSKTFHTAFKLLFPAYQALFDSPETLKTVTPQDLKEFQKKWYVPNNMVIVVTGPVQPDEIYKIAEQNFSAIPMAAIPDNLVREPALVTDGPMIVRQNLGLGAPPIIAMYRLAQVMPHNMNKVGMYLLIEEVLNNLHMKFQYKKEHKHIYFGASIYQGIRDFDHMIFYSNILEKPSDISKLTPHFQQLITLQAVQDASKRVEARWGQMQDDLEEFTQTMLSLTLAGLDANAISEVIPTLKTINHHQVLEVLSNIFNKQPNVIIMNKSSREINVL